MPSLPVMSIEEEEVQQPVASTSTLPSAEEEIRFPTLTRAAVDACAFKSWYTKYKRITPKATILDLDDGFVEYLKSDGLFLPDDGDESDEA